MSPYPVAPQTSMGRAIEIVEAAFLPLRCVAEFSVVDNVFGFAVYLPQGGRELYEEDATIMQNTPRLKTTLEVIRKRISASGIALAPWDFPDT